MKRMQWMTKQKPMKRAMAMILALLLIWVSLFAVSCRGNEESKGYVSSDVTYRYTDSPDSIKTGETGKSDSGTTITPSDVQFEAGTLTAREWSDVENWDFWTTLLNENDWYEKAIAWKMVPTKRVKVICLSEDGSIGGTVKVRLVDAEGTIVWQSVSNNMGVAYLYYGLNGKKPESTEGWHIIATVQNNIESYVDMAPVDWNGEDEVTLTILNARTSSNLDLMFVIDATGSMGDELEYLKVELADVIEKAKQQAGLNDVRISVNFYRDEDDTYVVKSFDFTEDLQVVQSNLEWGEAGGGGDYPEAVHKALRNALNDHEWRETQCSNKLLFLVLDAPAHEDDEAVVTELGSLASLASQMGVRIIPVAASGVDTACETMCRDLAVLTGGTYIYLTDDSGYGESHLEATVGYTQLEALNECLVRVITKYCKSAE